MLALKRGVFFLSWLSWGFVLGLWNVVRCVGAHRTDKRIGAIVSSRLYYVAPIVPGDRSGGSEAIGNFKRALERDFDLISINLFEYTNTGGSLFSQAREKLLSSLPIPLQCSRFLLNPGTVRRKLIDEIPIFIEFVSGSLFLVFSFGLKQAIILRDHEVLCRRLMMEFQRQRGLARVEGLLRFWVCYLMCWNIYSKVDAIVTLTAEDAAYIRQYFARFADKVLHIPVCFTAKPGNVHPTPSKFLKNHLIYVANFYHRPNIDGLAWFLTECAPYLAVPFTLHIVGLNEPIRNMRLESPTVTLVKHGFVADLTQFDDIGIAVAPIVSGAGVRIKNLFLGSIGKAIVTTTLGNEGINFSNGTEAIIVNDGKQMAREINRLSENPADVITLGRNARAKVLKEFNPDKIATLYREKVFQARNSRDLSKVEYSLNYR